MSTFQPNPEAVKVAKSTGIGCTRCGNPKHRLNHCEASVPPPDMTRTPNTKEQHQ